VRRKYDNVKKIGHRSVVHPPVYSHPFVDTSSFSSISSRENLQCPVLSRLPGGTRRCVPRTVFGGERLSHPNLKANSNA
jgi:hypothetical protein